MSKVLVTESYLTDIGNAIRAKNKSTTKYKPSEMAKAIDSIVCGDPAVVVNSDSAWKYSITQKEHENIAVDVSYELVGDNTSGYKTKLIFTPSISTNYGYNAGTIRKTADDATLIDGLLKDGWAGIYNLNTNPSSNSISYYFFNDYNNHKSSRVNRETSIENLLILGYYTEDSSGNLVARTRYNIATYDPSTKESLKKYQNKYATEVGSNAFEYCSALTSIDLPNATRIGERAFYSCSVLTSVNLSNATSIGDDAFQDCSALTSIDLSNATSIGDSAFFSCYALTSIDLPNATSIGYRAFYDISSLKTIFLRSKTMCTCTGNPNITSSATIYVPESLINSYKTATYWSSYARMFKTLESIKLTKISIIGCKNINTYNGNTTSTYKASYNDGLVDPKQVGITWSITGNATISQNGVVTLKNASVGDKLTITATSTYNTSISTSLTVSVVNVAASMTVDLNNGQWVDSGTTIDGHTVYKSDAGSYHVDNGTSTCTINVFGYSSVTIYARSYAESSYDYLEIGPLDGTVARNASSNVLSTKNKASLTTYSSHTFTIKDKNKHTFQILYSKDSRSNTHDDRGYFYIVAE